MTRIPIRFGRLRLLFLVIGLTLGLSYIDFDQTRCVFG
jgi:hypothetical protein